MKIQEMFARRINREIKNVITVGTNESERFVKQELEEYVVTKELLRHFSDFYENYKKGILGETPKMGVWISGFFGSGKSHFLKMLSFLLENKEVAGKHALDYFKEGGKFTDAMLLADVELAAKTSTDAILFNIDAKNSAHSKHDKDAIVRVFLKVFHDKLGYYGEIAELAQLEHDLDKAGRYEEFQQKFQEKKGKTWKENRHDIFFNQDIIVEILVEMGIMSEPAARNWCTRATNPKAGDISIEAFAQKVKEYIEEKGNNHHVVFLVDEVGQYIGDDSKLMLNLQTVTEELGNACMGKAWVIVTSQQDIDTITANVKGNDFSKIQGRFDTRLSLSAANVDEVVKERILKKTATATETLEVLYDDKETTLKNLISFTGTAEKKIYASREDYAAIYPFVGYQFDLLGKVLTEVRTHGASGKSLADGERSMLAFFKETANDYREGDEHTLIPFSAFYRALDSYLDHSHRGVINKAYYNKHLNPEGKDTRENVFVIEVLKALFMVKYVREMDANVENITSLMVDNVRAERSVLREEVVKALRLLENEMLIQHQGSIYIFLTNEEQEINRRIERQAVETQEIVKRTAEIIFEEIIKSNKYTYPLFNNRYVFNYDQYVDDQSHYTNASNALKVKVITSLSDYDGDESTMMILSMQLPGIIIQLPNQDDFIREVRTAIKIETFIMRDSEAKSLSQYETIRVIKGNEARERMQLAKSLLTDALQEANIFINGHKADIGAKDIEKRVQEALHHLTQQLFAKLSYIEKPMDEGTTLKMLKSSKENTMDLFAGGGEANQHAISDMLAYITGKTGNHRKISMKTLKDHYLKRAPYGFVEDDIYYLVARLFKRGDISFSLQGEYVTLANRDPKEIYTYISNKGYLDKLMIEKRERVSDKDKKIVRDLLKELFGNGTATEDEDALMNAFLSHTSPMMEEMQNFKGQAAAGNYPGTATIETGIRLLDNIRDARTSSAFFRVAVEEREDLLDFADDYDNVKKFFTGSQKEIFDKAQHMFRIYQESQNYIADIDLENLAKRIKAILQNSKPYRLIKDLPQLREDFLDAYTKILEDKAEPIKADIENCRQRVMDELQNRPYKDKITPKVQEKFAELLHNAEHSNNINQLMSLSNQADAVKDKFLNEIAAQEERLAKEQEMAPPPPSGEKAKEKVRDKRDLGYTPGRTKYLKFREVAGVSSVEIKSEAALDSLLAKIKAKFMQELKDRDSIHIDF